MSDPPAFFRVRDGWVELSVRVTPKSAKDHISGVTIADARRAWLSVKVRAAPEKGAANAALERVLAEAMNIPKNAVRVLAGHTARLKTVRLDTNAPAAIERLRLWADERGA